VQTARDMLADPCALAPADHWTDFVPVQLDPAITFDALATLVEEELGRIEWRSLRDFRSANKRFRADFGPMLVRDLDARKISGWLRYLDQRTTLASKTRRRLLSFLRKVLTRAVTGGVLARNPVLELGREDVPANRVRDDFDAAGEVLAPELLEQYLSDARVPTPLAVLIGLCSLAGLRIGEAAATTFGQLSAAEPAARLLVDRQFAGKSRRIEPLKTHGTRKVPVHPALATLIVRSRAWYRTTLRRPERDEDLLAPCLGARGELRCWREKTALNHWHRTAEVVGLPSIRLHSLRHTFVSLQVRAGIHRELATACTHLPHTAGDAPGAYVHYSWAQLCGAVASVPVTLGVDR